MLSPLFEFLNKIEYKLPTNWGEMNLPSIKDTITWHCVKKQTGLLDEFVQISSKYSNKRFMSVIERLGKI